MVVGRRKQTVGRKPPGTGTQKKTVSRGAAKLKQAADKKLREHSEEIAESLYGKLMTGNVPCGKLLIALADGETDCEEAPVVRRRCNLAEELASEPEWDGELDEAEAETGLGQRETEG